MCQIMPASGSLTLPLSAAARFGSARRRVGNSNVAETELLLLRFADVCHDHPDLVGCHAFVDERV